MNDETNKGSVIGAIADETTKKESVGDAAEATEVFDLMAGRARPLVVKGEQAVRAVSSFFDELRGIVGTDTRGEPRKR